MPHREVVDILRSTLLQLERDDFFASGDACLAELKHSIVCSIAELELLRQERVARAEDGTAIIPPSIAAEDFPASGF